MSDFSDTTLEYTPPVLRSSSRSASEGTPTPPIPKKTKERKKAVAQKGRKATKTGRVQKKGKKKGKGARLEEGQIQTIEDLKRQRKTRAKELVEDLDLEQAKKLLLAVAERNPSLLLDIAAMVGRDEPEDPLQPEPSEVPDWCVCHRCTDMPTDAEKLCCGMAPEHCTSTVPQMELVITDPLVLLIQQTYRNDLFALHAIEEEDVNKASRHASYRQFVLWQFGRLFEGDRRVIPSCCVKCVRGKFPSPRGVYTGFIPGRLM